MPAPKESLPCANSPPMLDDMKTISMSQLTRNPTRIAQDIKENGPCRVRGPQGAMLLMDWRQYEGWLATIQAMRPDWSALFERMEREYEEGKGTDLEDVIAELGLEAPHRPARKRTARRAATRSAPKSRRRTPRGRTRAT